MLCHAYSCVIDCSIYYLGFRKVKVFVEEQTDSVSQQSPASSKCFHRLSSV